MEQKKIAIYSRKSKFTGKGESIENQIELCRNYIKIHYGDDALEKVIIFEDEGFSGGNLERPKFKLMMKEAKNKKISAIVCYRLDRISRNISDFAKLIEELNDLGVSFVSIKEQFDTTSPMGRAMMYIASVFSQLERETIAERIRDNMHELSKSGRWLGGITPTGYKSESIKNISIDGKVRSSCNLKLVEEEAKLVILIYEKFLEFKSLTEVDKYLLERGYESKNGKKFSRTTIKGILTNPVYMISDEEAYNYFIENKAELFSEKVDFNGKYGIMTYNKTLQKRGKSHKSKPMEEWIVSVGRHKGLIEGKQWVEVQKILGQNASKSYRKTRSNVALLSGVLYCGSCGSYMRPKLSKRLNKEGEQIYTYLCSLKERSKSHSCTMAVINGNTMDQMVLEQIKGLYIDKNIFVTAIKINSRRIQQEEKSGNESLIELNKKIAETESRINSLTVSLGEAGANSRPYILEQIEKLHCQKESLNQRKNEFKKLNIESDELLKGILSSFGRTVDLMTTEEKRTMIRKLIDKVVFDGENIHVYFLGSNAE